VLGLLVCAMVSAISAAPIAAAELPGANQESLNSVATIRGLAPEEAAKHLPVRLEGVVTFVFNTRSWFIQDRSAGIYVGNGVEAPPLSVGDVVTLEGVSDPGDYAPLIQPSRVNLLGHTNLPAATRVSFADLMTGHQDSQWVEVAGLVRAVESDPAG